MKVVTSCHVAKVQEDGSQPHRRSSRVIPLLPAPRSAASPAVDYQVPFFCLRPIANTAWTTVAGSPEPQPTSTADSL
jgi:hypothetical protein